MKRIIATIIAALVLLPSMASAAITTSLTSYWELNETSGTRADSHGSNTLTNNNSVGYTTGIISNAASFNSSNYLSVADNAGLSPTSALSIAFFMKPTLASGATYVMASKWSYNVNNGWFIRINGTEIEISLENYTYTGITSGLGLSNGTWYHVAMVFDGSGSGNSGRLKLYVDGVEKTLTYGGTIPSSITDTNNQFEVGGWSSVGYYFYGALDLFGFWGRAITSTEITCLYNSGSGVAYSSLSSCDGGGGTPAARRRSPLPILIGL